jgi:hypothetical protein
VQSHWPLNPSFRRAGLLAILLLSSLSLSGCNEEKARSLQAVATQFRTESLAAIDAIDTWSNPVAAPQKCASHLSIAYSIPKVKLMPT